MNDPQMFHSKRWVFPGVSLVYERTSFRVEFRPFATLAVVLVAYLVWSHSTLNLPTLLRQVAYYLDGTLGRCS